MSKNEGNILFFVVMTWGITRCFVFIKLILSIEGDQFCLGTSNKQQVLLTREDKSIDIMKPDPFQFETLETTILICNDNGILNLY